eukprot:superscaffoldBa00005278_g20133
MSRPNYDHIRTVEDLKNEFFALQRHNEFLRRETESLQQDNESLRKDNRDLSNKNEVLEKQNKHLSQRTEAMEVNNLSCMETMSQQCDNLQKEIQQIKKQIEDERSERSAEQRRDIQFETGLNDIMMKIYAELRSKEEESKSLQDRLYTATAQNHQDLGLILRTVGDIFNAEKEEKHKKRTHWFFRWFW